MTTTKSSLGEALASGKPIITAECVPPRGDAAAVHSLATALPAGLDAVIVADNPDKVYGSALACAALLVQEGRDVVMSMSTRDRNRIALESEALGASSLGVGSILCMSGNHQSLGAGPQAAGAYDLDSVQLTQVVKGLGTPGLLVGALAHPSQRPLELNLLRLRKKITAGADFLVTEPVFDVSGFEVWLDAIRAEGLDEKTAVIASVLPLTGLEQAEDLQLHQTYGPMDEGVVSRLRQATDPAAEGLSLAVEAASALKALPGLRGVHILSAGNEALAGGVIKAAGLA
jgi:methylenetetrahydrofolate reductase (NADPH)